MFKIINVCVLLFLLTACQTKVAENYNPINPAPTPKAKGSPQATTIKVMAYNLENLFDEIKDFEKNTVIPLNILDKKFTQIAKGIEQVGETGPDVLLVSEIENKRVLKMLNKKLTKLKYQTIELIDSNDERGIDVGVISRYPLAAKTKLHKMPFNDVNPTRGILEVQLRLPNKKILHVFAVHFPSQANPTEQRLQAAHKLRDLLNAVPENDFALAGGDFNISRVEESEHKIFRDVFKKFYVTHLVGCQSCVGTYYYKQAWTFLDAIIVREPILDSTSVQTPNKADTQLNADGSPKRFDKQTFTGISDHLPIYGELIIE